jgi:oleandomycin transport system permease protein
MTAATSAAALTGDRTRRVGPIRTLRHGLTLTGRSLLKIRHSPEQFLELSLQPVIFVTVFVFLFGNAISGEWRAYLQYVLPGIAAQTIIFASMGTGVGLSGDIQNGIFDRFRSLPIARSAPLIGHVLGDVVRYVVTIAVTFSYGALLGFRPSTGVVPFLAGCALIVLFSLAMCWIAALIGMLVRNPQSVQGIGAAIIFPLTFGSNLLVPSQKLPGWLQAWVHLNPVTHLNNAVRGLMEGGPVAHSVLYSLLWAAGIVAVFAPLAVAAYRRRVTA